MRLQCLFRLQDLICTAVSILTLLLGFSAARAQWLDALGAESNAGVVEGIGVSPYRHPPEHDHYRLTGLFGGSLALANQGPMTFGVMGSFQHDHHLITGAFIESSNNSRLPWIGWQEFDLLYGYALSGEFGQNAEAPNEYLLSVSVGAGLFDKEEWWGFGRRRRPATPTEYHPNTFDYSIGIPLQVQAIYAPIRYVGVGLTLFANFNKTQSNYGALVSLQIGYF